MYIYNFLDSDTEDGDELEQRNLFTEVKETTEAEEDF